MRARLLTCLLLIPACDGAAAVVSEPSGPETHDEAFLRAYMTFAPGERKHHDPLAIIELDPHMSWTVRWKEHPEGKLRRATNNLGFKEDEDTLPEKRGLRILVAGDSHTEGMVSNDELFTHLLELRLRESGWADAEVLNAGVGYTGPYCYLGVLRKHLALRPDVFVATVYSGNDFMDDLRVAYLRDRHAEPVVGEDYYAPLERAAARWSGACWQSVNQAYRLERFPEEIQRALDAVERSLAEIQELCAKNGVLFLTIVLPTKYDTDLDDRASQFDPIASHLGLTAEDLGTNARLAAELRERLEARGVHVLAPAEACRTAGVPVFWRTDHHLNVAGHALLAERLPAALEPHLAALRESSR